MQAKSAKESRAIKAAMVLTPDANHHGTMFGGKVMAYIDDIAALSATRHARMPVVTASDRLRRLPPPGADRPVGMPRSLRYLDPQDLHRGLRQGRRRGSAQRQAQCLHHRLSHLRRDRRRGRPQPVPPVSPETELEQFLHAGGAARAESRRTRRDLSKQLASRFGTLSLWQQ